eukprot:15430497-Alexandrium_andersonii.AAC.1
MAQNAPLGTFGDHFEAVPGPARLKLRTPEASLYFVHGRLRIGSGCSTGGLWADCGVHAWRPAM